MSRPYEMGYWYRICGRLRANERFSGRGHKVHVCKECSRVPSEHRRRIEEEEETVGFLSQSNISRKNLARLRTLVGSPIPEIAEVARLVLAVAEVHPHKRGRLKCLARQRRDLLAGLEASGLIYVCQ